MYEDGQQVTAEKKEREFGMKKKITIAVLVIICVAVIFIFGYEILFPTYKTLDINEDSIKCIKVESYNKAQNFTFENSDEIKEIMDYLYSVEYRSFNNYEKIIGDDTMGPVTIAYKISIYSNTECKDTDLIMTIKVARGDTIDIDDKVYKLNLSDEELASGSDENVYGKLFDIIHDTDEDIVKIK